MHPGVIAMLSATAVVLLFATLVDRPRQPQGARGYAYLGYLGIVLFGALLLATRTRSDLLASVAASGVMLVRRVRPRTDILALVVIGSLAILGLVVTSFGGMDFFSRFLSDDSSAGAYLLRGQRPEYFLTLSGRTVLWREMLPLVAARPVLGWGFESTRSVLLDVFFWAAYAHNAMMQALMGLGVVGAALLMALFGSCFVVGSAGIRNGHDASAFARTAVVGMAVYLGIQAVVSESFAGTPGFPVLVAFVCMLSAAELRRQTGVPAGSGTRPHRTAVPAC